MSRQLTGRDILRWVRRRYQKYRGDIDSSGKGVAIIRFDAGSADSARVKVRMQASRVSADQKVKAFSSLGFQVHEEVLGRSVHPLDFSRLIHRFNVDEMTTGIIVQMPTHDDLRMAVQRISGKKDIDALLGGRSPYRACATADGIVRVAEPFVQDKPLTAVVGGKGFVGQGVAKLLRDKGVEPMVLDAGDDLRAVRDAEVVISATGHSGVLGREHLRPGHRIVVDSGFVPQRDGTVLGDVRKDAVDIPQVITPVPGGIGPVEMAVLMERVVQKEVDPSIPSWSISPEAAREMSRERHPSQESEGGRIHLVSRGENRGVTSETGTERTDHLEPTSDAIRTGSLDSDPSPQVQSTSMTEASADPGPGAEQSDRTGRPSDRESGPKDISRSSMDPPRRQLPPEIEFGKARSDQALADKDQQARRDVDDMQSKRDHAKPDDGRVDEPQAPHDERVPSSREQAAVEEARSDLRRPSAGVRQEEAAQAESATRSRDIADKLRRAAEARGEARERSTTAHSVDQEERLRRGRMAEEHQGAESEGRTLDR
ncbi:tetrahydrofolate dehydrogenase/cyclohydrolase catalytic domain-containing protein [Nocardiopsis rhodophaea]|uniref:tetrahydrofolate dehydrogenase/cyclohydrolase catalytic domain-containing protein n=1 Tax=Nocardiopsis rhodophaea TaxID=280238 RepID=UPI0031DF0E94